MPRIRQVGGVKIPVSADQNKGEATVDSVLDTLRELTPEPPEGFDADDPAYKKEEHPP